MAPATENRASFWARRAANSLKAYSAHDDHWQERRAALTDCIQELAPRARQILALRSAFSANIPVLFAGLEDGTLRAWSTADATALLVPDTGYRNINRVTVTANRSLLATVGDGDCGQIWECQLP